MRKLNFKKNIIFDLDGVLIDSLANMKISWKITNNKYDLNIPFKEYQKYIGLPFREILKKLGINSFFFNLIEKEYNRQSKKNLKNIKFYPNVLNTLGYLQKKNYFIGVLTSKNKLRTNLILKKLKFNFKIIQTPQKHYKGKPYPDLLIKIIKEKKLKKKECIYIGDAVYDLLMCNRAKVDFIFAKYGYQIGMKNYKYKINNFKEIKKIL